MAHLLGTTASLGGRVGLLEIIRIHAVLFRGMDDLLVEPSPQACSRRRALEVPGPYVLLHLPM